MKLLAVVVLYHPEPEVERNILSYSNGCDMVVLWDNTPKGAGFIPRIPNALILNDNHRNMGLGYAYNRAVQIAKENGCTHIMTMDQDSCFENFSGYREWIESMNYQGISSVAINRNGPDGEECTVINDSAQSGSVFPLTLLEEIGLFREDFFIGMVDAEMCLRAQEHDYRTLQYNRANLVHHIGSERIVRLFGRATQVSDYIPLRHYYDSRNRILMWHEFPYDCSLRDKCRHLLGRVKVIFKILAFEDNKWAKVQAIVSGTCYGLLNRAKPYKHLTA